MPAPSIYADNDSKSTINIVVDGESLEGDDLLMKDDQIDEVGYTDNFENTVSVKERLEEQAEPLLLKKKDVLPLNVTTARQLNLMAKSHASPYSIDVLIVGSKHNTKAARKQFETWASHSSIRHFVLATEYDDPDPNCSSSSDMNTVETHVRTCRKPFTKLNPFWEKQNAVSKLTSWWKGVEFARLKWLQGKPNPAGWLCAQKRFVSGFTKLVNLYANKEGSLPDYLIVADDDTYINIEHITEYLVKSPRRQEQQGISDEERYVPVPNTAAIFAGCRLRSPDHELKWTYPFGGFGTFLSKGALQRWMQPIHCEETTSLSSSTEEQFEQAICQKYLHNSNHEHTYPFNATIGEGRFFQSGKSLNQVMHSYIHEMKYFCLHSDWFFGYIANFLNVSRHVVKKGEKPVAGQGTSALWFDQYIDDRNVSENRLHSIMGSELYGNPEGFCLYGNGLTNAKHMTKEAHKWIPSPPGKKYNRLYKVNQTCQANTTICHYMKEDDMERIHKESLKFLMAPSK
jgi:hypothetical protein